MKTMADLEAFIQRNEPFFRSKFRITKIGIFGSYARGEQTAESDLDLIVEFEENTNDLYDLKLQLKDFFLTRTGLKIDICREKYIKPRFRKSILREARYVY